MSETFAITTTTTSVSLDAQRRGKASFTVSNASERRIRARASPTSEDSSAEAWLTLVGEVEQDLPIAGTQQYAVQITVPPEARAGSYTFRLDMVDVDNPDEGYARGPTVTFVVPEPVLAKKPFPWWVAVAAAVLAVIAVLELVALTLALTNRSSQAQIKSTLEAEMAGQAQIKSTLEAEMASQAQIKSTQEAEMASQAQIKSTQEAETASQAQIKSTQEAQAKALEDQVNQLQEQNNQKGRSIQGLEASLEKMKGFYDPAQGSIKCCWVVKPHVPHALGSWGGLQYLVPVPADSTWKDCEALRQTVAASQWRVGCLWVDSRPDRPRFTWSKEENTVNFSDGENCGWQPRTD